MIVLATAMGCGGSTTIDPYAGLDEDEKAINELVYSLADSANDLEQFRSKFAKDKVPASTEAKKYKEYMFYVRGDISVTGTTGSFTVGVETQEGEAEPVIVEKQWTAVKEADGWKLGDAPLP